MLQHAGKTTTGQATQLVCWFKQLVWIWNSSCMDSALLYLRDIGFVTSCHGKARLCQRDIHAILFADKHHPLFHDNGRTRTISLRPLRKCMEIFYWFQNHICLFRYCVNLSAIAESLQDVDLEEPNTASTQSSRFTRAYARWQCQWLPTWLNLEGLPV